MSLSKGDGGCGLAVKAPDCGSGYRGFESRQPPCRHFSSLAHLPARSGRTNRCPRCGEPHHPPRIGFVHNPPGRAPMIQIQTATNFALILVWLRLAPFAAPGTPVALARCCPEGRRDRGDRAAPGTPVALARWGPGGGVDAPWRRSQHFWGIDSLLSPSSHPSDLISHL